MALFRSRASHLQNDSWPREPIWRGRSRDRHGRGVRSSVTGPLCPPMFSRQLVFEQTVLETAQALTASRPDELRDVRFLTSGMPPGTDGEAEELPRWSVDRDARQIVLFWAPIERLSRIRLSDEIEYRIAVERATIGAVSDYLGFEPWIEDDRL